MKDSERKAWTEFVEEREREAKRPRAKKEPKRRCRRRSSKLGSMTSSPIRIAGMRNGEGQFGHSKPANDLSPKLRALCRERAARLRELAVEL